MDWLVLSTDTFDKKAAKHNIPNSRIDSICKELKINPYVGKSLSYKFLREKRYEGKRIYYLIYEDIKLVLLVSVSDKKTQQDTIEVIQDSFEEYKILATKIAKEVRNN